MSEGDELVFSMTWFPSYAEPTDLGVSHDRIEETIREDEEWAARCTTDIPHPDVVRRSLLTLRLMTDEVTGGIVAAPTTSLPEDFGGERNWDYRYCWLRDSALTLDSLVQAGYTEEADVWRDWLLRTIAGDPAQMQIMYAVDGSRRLPEVTLDHLPGYADSRPVRIGNGAVEQTQNDVLGEVMHALDRVRRAEGMPHQDAWPLQRALVAEMATRWQKPDHGLWEIRGEPRAFTHSRVDDLGRLRPCGPRDGGLRRRRAARGVAGAARRDPRGGAREGVRRRARHVRAALRHHRGRRLAAGAPAGRLRRR